MEDSNVVLCHSFQDKSPDTNGYHFVRTSDKGAGWGVWVWAEKSRNGKIIGRKIRPAVEQRQTFDYPDRDNNPLIRVVRRKGAEVEFYQEYWVDGRWIPASKVDDVTKQRMRKSIPIYRYQDIQAAMSRNESIWFVEGESAADALWSIGIPATTTIGGSKGYRSWGSYQQDLAGADLILCPDRDKEGIAYIDEVAKDFPQHRLYRVFKNSPVWEFLPDAGGLDIADEIAGGATKEAILEAIIQPEAKAETAAEAISYQQVLEHVSALERQYSDEAELDWHLREFIATHKLRQKGYSPAALLRLVRSKHDTEQAVQLVDAIDILESGVDGREWVVPALVPLGSSIICSASGGVGKTTLVYNLAKHIALGRDWSGMPVKQGKVLIVQTDEPIVDIKDKLDIGQFFEVPRGMVHFITKWRFSQIRQLEGIIKEMQPVLIVIDSYTAAHAGMGIELTRSSAGDSIYKIRDIAQEQNCAFIIIHHLNKLNEMRDSSTIKDNCSETWMIYRDEKSAGDKHEMLLEIGKSRAGIAGKYIMRRDPLDYSWRHLGPADGQQSHLSRVMILLGEDPQKTWTPYQLANRMDLSTVEVAETLELGRRMGMIQGKWAIAERNTPNAERFRVYSCQPPRDDSSSDYEDF